MSQELWHFVRAASRKWHQCKLACLGEGFSLRSSSHDCPANKVNEAFTCIIWPATCMCIVCHLQWSPGQAEGFLL